MSVESEKSTKTGKSVDVFTANRRLEGFLGINPDESRGDQKGSLYPFEVQNLRRQHITNVRPKKGEIIATITFDHARGKVICDYPDGTHIED